MDLQPHQGLGQMRHECWSDPARGSRFDVYLPAIDESDVPHTPGEETIYLPTLPVKWVLVVDDEPAILSTLQSMLENQGLKVASAADGAEALAMFVKHTDQFDLIITDMAMPIMDGAATIRAVRKLNSSIPIVAMSGLTEIDVESTFAEDKNIRYMSKPFRSRDLLNLISELVEA